MKIYRVVFMMVCMMLLMGACKKQASVSVSFAEEAKNYFSSLPAFPKDTARFAPPFRKMNKIIDWGKGGLKKISTGSAIVIPVHYERPVWMVTSFDKNHLQDIGGLQWVFMYKDNLQNWHTELVTQFGPVLQVEDWQGHLLKEYKYYANGDVKKWVPSAAVETSRQVEVCYTSSGYNYQVSDPANGYAWTVDLGCEYYFIEDIATDGTISGIDYGVDGTGGPSAPKNPSMPLVVVYSGKNIIGDIYDYTKCFDNIAGSTKAYSVTVCVEQPIPGSREAWGFSGTSSSATNNPISVGHTFMILTETGDDGNITRNVGFYPKANVDPTSPVINGQLNNDNYVEYDVSLTIKMDNSQFFKVLSFINHGNDAGYKYDLNSNNCTTFVLNALSNAGIILPATKGDWVGGAGYDPGDLGEDIRSMHLSPNMTRKTVSNSHPNIGSCY